MTRTTGQAAAGAATSVKTGPTVAAAAAVKRQRRTQLRRDAFTDVIDFPGRTATAAAAVGGLAKVADLLEVSRSQPTRWRQGIEQPSPEMARLIVDLDHVMARAQLVFTPKVARQWLVGSNSYLDGARPIDVLRIRGSSEVIDALDAAMQGAYS